MPGYAYLQVTVHHAARELNISEGGVPRQVEGGYFRLPAVLNELGADGWLLATSVHEQIDGIGDFTLHIFSREA